MLSCQHYLPHSPTQHHDDDEEDYDDDDEDYDDDEEDYEVTVLNDEPAEEFAMSTICPPPTHHHDEDEEDFQK